MLCGYAGVCLVSGLFPWYKCTLFIQGTFTLKWLHIVEFQGEANRKLWLLSPLSAGQRPWTIQKSGVLSSLTPHHFLVLSAHPHLLIFLSTYAFLLLLSAGASKVLALTSSALRSSFWRRDMFVTAGRGKEPLPGCVPKEIPWQLLSLDSSEEHSKLFSHFGAILPRSKVKGKWLLTAGLSEPSPPRDLNPSLFWPVSPGKKNKCKREVCLYI